MKKFSIPVPGNPFLKFLPVISLFVFAAFFIPLAGSVFLFLLPMILFVSGAVHGLIKTATTFLISFSLFLILAMLLHLHVPAIAVFAIGVAGLFMAIIAVKNYSIEKTIIYPSLFIVLAVCFSFVYDGFIHAANPWQLAQKYIAATIAENVKLYSQLPLKAEDINYVKDNAQNMINGFTQIFPSMVIIAAVLIVWMNFLLGNKLLKRSGIIYPEFAALARWKAPDLIIWIFIVSGALFLVPQKDVNFIGLNIFLVVCSIYLLQSLAIVSFLFQTKNVPAFFRYFFYFLIAVQQILMIPMVAIGLFDIWIDFRKFFQKDQTTV